MPSLMTSEENRRLSRLLALMLRHQPTEFDLFPDTQGFVQLKAVLDALHRNGYQYATLQHIEEVVASGDKRRYEIRDDLIRAVYGHSVGHIAYRVPTFCPSACSVSWHY